MAIETLEDWNAILSQCCCEMPGCPLPSKECESIVATGILNGYVPTADPAVYDPNYAVTVLTYSGADPAVVTFTRNCIVFITIGGVDFSVGNGDIDVVYSGGDDYGNPIVTTYESPKSEADTISDTRAAATASLDFESETQTKGASCAASFAQPIASGSGSNFTIALTYVRIRWIIPDTFEGSYFKITWDVLTEPTDPLAQKSYIEDLTWEWTGPGDPDDVDSWKSGWYEIAPPGEPGTRTVVNIRYECYRSTKFGNKPQTTGTGEDTSDDVPLQARFTSDRHSINLATV